MFVSPLLPMFKSFVPHTESWIPLGRKKHIQSKKAVSDAGKLILISSHFHIAKIVGITQSFTGHVRMMQMYFYVDDFMNAFK